MAEQSSKWNATRIGILVIVVVFFVTSFTLSAFAIYELTRGEDTATNAVDQTAMTCMTDPNKTEEVLPAPEVYKSEGDVTKLEKTDLEEGTGQAAQAGDCLVVKYYGTLASNGTLFDESFTQPTAFAFELGSGSVIPGWDQGVVGMKEGGVRRLVIPSELAYGEQSPSEAIPANSDLVFVVKLLRIEETENS